MNKSLLQSWRANFLTGLAVILPVVVSVGIFVWFFRNISTLTDLLLFFLPAEWTHENGPGGPVRWYWSIVAFCVAILLVSALGRMTRLYIGRQLLLWMDMVLLRVPMLNKVYSTVKQVNEAFSSTNKSSFKQVVMVEYPRPGCFSLGFLTSELGSEVSSKAGKAVVSVFIPTTPNPTSGFLVMFPEDQVTKLDMPVADGIRYIISLGTVAPDASRHGGSK